MKGGVPLEVPTTPAPDEQELSAIAVGALLLRQRKEA
jgi:hypothetical protein